MVFILSYFLCPIIHAGEKTTVSSVTFTAGEIREAYRSSTPLVDQDGEFSVTYLQDVDTLLQNDDFVELQRTKITTAQTFFCRVQSPVLDENGNIIPISGRPSVFEAVIRAK